MTKRLSLNERDAAHVYEWLRMYWTGDEKFGNCALCELIGRRLERFIGPRETRRIASVVKSHPR
jgi:hypothetical protein